MSNYKHPIRDPNVGSIIDDRYYLQSLIGRGATSSVYEATDSNAEQSVAVKLMHSHLVSEEMIVSRFAQEAKTARLLQHPNIVKVEEYNVTENGVPYLIMELVKGTSLHDVVKGAGWLPTARAFAIFAQVCAALAAAHEKSIVHRDLKPSNIMLTTTDGGELLVKVLDFGIAKQISMEGDTAALRLTQAGEALGSLLYMSPEQCLDQDIDSRSDCYSMGCVMYETLTGKPPLCARTAFETMNKQISEMPERLDRVRPDLTWPEGLQEVIFKSLSKKPSDRYQKIHELQDDLQNIAARKIPDATRSQRIGIPEPLRESIKKPPQTLAEPSIRRRQQLQKAQTDHRDLVIIASFFISMVLLVLFFPLCIAVSKGLYSLATVFGLLCAALTGWLVWSLLALRNEGKKLSSRVAIVEKNKPMNIEVTKISPTQNLNQPTAGAVHIAITIEYVYPGSTKVEQPLPIQPLDPVSHTWGSLCTASQLEQLNQSHQTFPLPALLFTDSSEKPIAVEILDHLAWVTYTKTGETQHTNTTLSISTSE